MVGVGTDSLIHGFSVKPDILGLFVAVLSFYVILRQLKLMERQDIIINRKADLISQVSYDEITKKFRFDVQNIGNRTLKNFDWHIWAPTVFAATQIDPKYTPPKSSDRTQEINGKSYVHYGGNFKDEVYPTRAKTFAELPLPTPILLTEFYFFHEMACEDGIFPPKMEEAPLMITIK